MPKLIISDTSCLIILSKIGELDLLRQLYGTIITTSEVMEEFGEALPEWIEMYEVKDKQKQLLLEMQLDKGEASAITLALENRIFTIILDDTKARKIAEKLGISYTGTIGIIVKAKLMGIIPSVKYILDKIRVSKFHISDEIEKKALRMAGEIDD